MSYYGYEYFCGANVTVRLNDVPVLEAAGISYELSSSKRPLWGYSSVYFDAVGRGQDIVNGTLLVNYIHEDYLFRLLEYSIGSGGVGVDVRPSAPDIQGRAPSAGDIEQLLAQGGTINQFANRQRERYWNLRVDEGDNFLHATGSVVDWASSVQIKIVFGDQDFGGFRNHGKTGVLLEAVHFTGESKVIRIDEETVVEAYPFFARNHHSIRNTTRLVAN